jgi:LysM repeat protein
VDNNTIQGGNPPQGTPVPPAMGIGGGNPPSGNSPQGTAGPVAGTTVYMPFLIRPGMTLQQIAAKWHIGMDTLKQFNQGSTFAAGTQINIPIVATAGQTWQQLASEGGIGAQHLENWQKQFSSQGTTSGANADNSSPFTPTEASELNTLQGANRDAYAALINLFNSYGLSTLAPKIFNYVQQGFSSDTISILLQSTPEYEQRFAGNAARMKNGLPVLSPAEYLATEASYRQIVQSAGLPANFYDSHSDFVQWIGQDVSPAEVQSRVNMAQQATQAAPPDLVKALGVMGVPTGSLVAYFLDDAKALPILQQQFNAAQIGASALRNGLAMDANRATTFANMGISVSQANSAYQQIGMTLPTLEMLGRVYNQTYTQQSAENNLIMGNGQAALATEKLSAQERSAFSGTSAINQQSLGTAPPPTGAGKY